MRIIADTHTHTLACDHAYSTLEENAQAAAQRGLAFLAMTEHTPQMPGAPSYLHFHNLAILPRTIGGVTLLKGAEVNILDSRGSVDLPERILERLEWVIASMHTVTFEPADKAAHTRAWLAIAENPHIDVIGHCGDTRYPFDWATVLPAFKAHGKIVEINNHSFAGTARQGSEVNCRGIAQLCAQLGIPVVVSSDAHHCTRVGTFEYALAMLEEIDFPRELILNAEHDRFLETARRVSGKALTD